jgi:hypothetical protein
VAIVVLMDQRNSSAGADLVEPASRTFNERFAAALGLGFVRTAGDEMQAVLRDAAALPDLLAEALETRAWWIGLGLGTISRVGESARASTGPAFKSARKAIDAAKRDRSAPGPAVRGDPHELAESLQAALAGWAFIRAKRTARQREVVAQVRAAPSRRAAAERLGITHQAVSDALIASGHDPEEQLRGLIARIAGQAAGA